jgi:hypothetical protein
VLNGFPSIVIGIFVFTLIVKTSLPVVGWGHHQSAFAGGFALSIIMLPLVVRVTMEVLTLVPNELREASYALGVSKWQTVLRVVLPTSFGGILTGTTLAIARAAGETAPLLFTCAIAGQVVDWNPTHSVQSIPLMIFQNLSRRIPTSTPRRGRRVRADRVRARDVTARFLLDRSRRKPACSARESNTGPFTTRHRAVTARQPIWTTRGVTLPAHETTNLSTPMDRRQGQMKRGLARRHCGCRAHCDRRRRRQEQRYDDCGAGSTFVSPLVSTDPATGSAFGYTVQYSAVGSAPASLRSPPPVDFGASDARCRPTRRRRARAAQIRGRSRDFDRLQHPGGSDARQPDGRTISRIFSGRSRTGTTPRSRRSTRERTLPT